MTDRLSMSEYKRLTSQMSVSATGRVVPVSKPVDTPKKAMFALGRLKPGQMNKTEAAYAAHLESLKAAGEIVWYVFESLTFKLADDTRYTPDFAVMLSSGQMQAHEVKGFWQDDARVKIKVAAAKFPFEFIAVKAKAKKDGGGWSVEAF